MATNTDPAANQKPLPATPGRRYNHFLQLGHEPLEAARLALQTDPGACLAATDAPAQQAA